VCVCVCVCVTGEVLQRRLEMARDLKRLTDLSHTMSATELDDLRLHIKVPFCISA